ncbi:MAG: hypothetical protein V7K69_20895 [Nostoc sp.]|uniref:hypothetical protein n=1 Tax=Nostoc sp. TaxID=1180 RepID=UPI002FF777BB
MTPDEIKRLRYYEKQYLRTQDFQDEQAYHIEMRRRHLIAHHSWGIVVGLEIKQDPISKIWAVQPGIAVDGYGREIVVFEPEELNLIAIANQLSGQSLPALLKIWIAYTIEPTNRPATGYETCNGKDEFTRIRESFRLVYRQDFVFDDSKEVPQAFQSLPDDPQQAPWYIYLGTIAWDKNPANPSQNIITSAVPVDPVNQKGRHYVGVVATEAIAPDNQLLLRGRTKSTPPASTSDPAYDDVAVKLSGTLQVTKYLTVGPFTATTGDGGIDVTGSVAEFGFVKRTLTSWPSPPVAGDRFVWYNPDGNARLWTEKNGDLFTVTPQGNVGIKTLTPGATLDVLGSFRLNNGTVLSKIESGTIAVGSSASKNKEITVTFPVNFSGIPKVIASARAEPNTTWPDTFAVSTRSLDAKQFTVNIIRVDSVDGWTQNLQLDWIAWE